MQAATLSHAATLYWDINGNGTGLGGLGTWNTTNAFWNTSATGTGGTVSAWNNGLLDDAVFSGTPDTVTVGTVSVHNLNFDIQNYRLTGGTITLGGSNPTITTSVVGSTTRIDSVIAGSAGLIKMGPGILRLDGANTYTGVTQLKEGSFDLENASALGASTAASTFLMSPDTTVGFNNATYAYNLTATAAGTIHVEGQGGTWSGAPTLSGGNAVLMEIGNASNNTYSGNFTNGGGTLSVKITSGQPLFTGTNTYSGSTTIDSATLRLGSTGALSPNTNLVFASSNVASPSLLGLSDDFIRPLGTTAGRVQWAGGGGFAAYSGNPKVNIGGAGGTLVWGSTSFLAPNDQFMLGITNGTSLTFQNDLNLPTDNQLYSLSVGGGTVSQHTVLSGAISGAGDLNLNAAGVFAGTTGFVELTGNNVYTGDLVLGANGSLANVIVSNASGLSTAGGIRFNGPAGTQGNNLILISGNFTRALGTGANQVQWTGNGGFAAYGAARSVNLGGAGAQMTWNTGGFVPTGFALQLGINGNAVIDFQNPINLNGAVRRFQLGSGGAELSGVLSGTGASGVDYRGGSVTPSDDNTYTGVTTATSATINVSKIGNGGTAGNLGQASNAPGNLVLSESTLNYIGAGETTDRGFTIGDGTNAFLTSNGTGALVLNGAIVKGTGATSLFLGGNTAANVVNEISGVLSDGAPGALSLRKSNNNTWRVSNVNNSYSGITVINAGVLEVTALANGGVNSSIGRSSSAASNLLAFGGTLRYIGAGGATDRSFQLNGDFTIESSGTSPLAWMSTTPIAGNGPFTLTLGGIDTGGTSRFLAPLTNIAGSSNANPQTTGLSKTGAGSWSVEAPNQLYTGNTTITDGDLQVTQSTGITGGFGVTSNSVVPAGYVSTTPGSSLIVFNGVAGTSGGVLMLTAGSGNFSRNLTTVTRSFSDNGTPGNTADDSFVQGVRWTGSGGFAAVGGARSVNIGGAGAQMTWNTGGFVPTGQNLILGNADADSTLDFQNPITLAGAARTFDVRDGLAAVD
ncbi:MAG TPA: autotransporter-associated beta strand repeat-containing protein, partial [Burkholderiaceae bacterium]|nr:autotransporter-associated beta strand repeat-containing protein [Burkholderiaceae bacterium]